MTSPIVPSLPGFDTSATLGGHVKLDAVLATAASASATRTA